MDLERLFLEDDAAQRVRRTARHEAGHAAAAWLIQGSLDAPPFEYIEIGTLAQHAGGVVPGGVKYDVAWFDALSPVDRGAILLAGVYSQKEYEEPHVPEEWRELLDGLEGTDGVDDYARVIDIARESQQNQHDFDRQALERLVSLEPMLRTFTGIIASSLASGVRMPATDLVSHLKTRLTQASSGSTD